ncbi:hypothetical protein NG798_19875 [Ancylothrix sp. C2]|uniref:hypothetical protein n=1 Tax=Ancylothrix sp. D3o TaxID=2953691 RepID=UPI0021BA9813|nr:hypothetical protein [Ancylothrix sp. D3o]MCT7952061.1 hypothetical protein [Ancylothrix sp. D3o]
MAITTLKEILNQLDKLETPELKELNQTIQKYLTQREESVKKAGFHQALIDSGLVKQIKYPISYEERGERQLIEVEGKPVSETIIEERR